MVSVTPSAAPPQERQRDRAATASYVAKAVEDLAGMARSHGFDTLGYILEMAKLEAENILRHERQ